MSPTKENGISLLCTIHPSSQEAKDKILNLLRKGAREYYTRPEAKCSTWSYFTPFPPKAENLTIAGLEIYEDKKALQKQVDDKEFYQEYHERVKLEGLYDERGEELVGWYFTEGFIARERDARPFGGNLISLTKFVAKTDREDVLKIIRSFVPFVRDQEPGVLTYASFTRPKAPKEVLLFVRYADRKALKGHSEAREHVDVVKKIMKVIGNDMGRDTSLWTEVEDSFVSTEVGGQGVGSKL